MMIKLLTNADLPAALSYMHKYSLETPFLLPHILAHGLENRSSNGWSGDYFGFFEGPELLGVAGFYNSANCMLHYSRASDAPIFAELLLKNKFLKLTGLQSRLEPLLPMFKGRRVIRDITENEYMINLQPKVHTIANAEFVSVSELGEEAAYTFLANAYGIAVNGRFNRMDLQRRLPKQPEAETYLFLKVDGKVKAQAYINNASPNVAQISGVYTLDHERGKGYGKAITSELCTRSISRGKIPVLTVSKDNSAAKRAYESIGFTRYDSLLVVSC